MKNEVQVVLATYNGAVYLNDQIGSIVCQLGDGRILAHDDGSSDQTTDLLRSWAAQDDRLELLDAPPAGGASANFSLLLEYTTASYIFCADQDDVWLPDKLERLLKQIRFYESVYGSEMPLLVHSDLRLIDQNGQALAPSLWRYQNLDPRWGNCLKLLLTQNVITGCAMVVNRALLDKALPIPAEAVMHDWWLGLVASAFGKVIWLDEPTVLYRQHNKNEVGAKRFDAQYLFMKLSSFHERENARRSLLTTAAQAAAFAERFPEAPQVAQARLFAQLPSLSSWKRRRVILKQQFFKIGWARNLAWLGLS